MINVGHGDLDLMGIQVLIFQGINLENKSIVFSTKDMLFIYTTLCSRLKHFVLIEKIIVILYTQRCNYKMIMNM